MADDQNLYLEPNIESLREAYFTIRDSPVYFSWAVFGYQAGCNNLMVVDRGQGLDTLTAMFDNNRARYAYLSFLDPGSATTKLLFIGMASGLNKGEQTSTRRTENFNRHFDGLSGCFKKDTCYTVTSSAEMSYERIHEAILRLRDRPPPPGKPSLADLASASIIPAYQSPVVGSLDPLPEVPVVEAAPEPVPGVSDVPPPIPPKIITIPISMDGVHPILPQEVISAASVPAPVTVDASCGTEAAPAAGPSQEEQERIAREEAEARDKSSRRISVALYIEAILSAQDRIAKIKADRAERDRFEFEYAVHENAQREARELEAQMQAGAASAAPAPVTEEVAEVPPVPAVPANVTAIARFPYNKGEGNEIDMAVGDTIVDIIKTEFGWYYGTNTSTGLAGLFPANYVEEQIPQEATPAPEEVPSEQPQIQEEAIPRAKIVAIAKYDFPASEANEISFNKGDIIQDLYVVTEQWWKGTKDGATGLFPRRETQDGIDCRRFQDQTQVLDAPGA
ncbi:hypothetical protein BGX34_005444 [Mortierella sp. NVP85]|nr:hypothetical protein BGX34_005444 [Mortierella sp. NVP85]